MKTRTFCVLCVSLPIYSAVLGYMYSENNIDAKYEKMWKIISSGQNKYLSTSYVPYIYFLCIDNIPIFSSSSKAMEFVYENYYVVKYILRHLHVCRYAIPTARIYSEIINSINHLFWSKNSNGQDYINRSTFFFCN